MLKLTIILCAVSLSLATYDAIRYMTEHNKAVTKINTMYIRTAKIFENFRNITMIHLSKHGKEILTKIDDSVSNMTKGINEFAISQNNNESGSLVCLEDWSKLKRLVVESKVKECLGLQEEQLQNCTKSLEAKFTNIMIDKIYNGSQKCEKIVVLSAKSNAASNPKTICYGELVNDVRASLDDFKDELRWIKKALRKNNPTAINLEDCRVFSRLKDNIQEYLLFLRENKKCFADLQ